MTLRPQQEVFEQAIKDAFRSARCVLGVAATGFGKGFVIADMAFKSAAKGRVPMVVTNRRVIVHQIRKECAAAGLRVGIIMGSEEPDPEAQVQVASIQTLKRRDFYGMPDAGFCIIDEAHQEPVAYAKMMGGRLAGVPVLGLTATPVGPGGSRLGHFQAVVEPIKNTEVIAAGDLLPVRYIAPFEPDMEGINLKTASRDEIGNRVEECKIYADVFGEWEPYKDQQTLAILPSVATANTFLNHCLSRGVSARLIDGSTTQDERDEAFGEFADETTRMLVSVDVLREGFNAPNAQVLLMLQPTHQFRVFWQACGRVKRPHPPQTYSTVIDCAGNLHRFNIHPDHDPPWDELTNDTTIEDILDKKAGVRCPKCGSRDIYSIDQRYKCEDCKHEWDMKKAFVCPHCKQALGPNQRIVDGECPNCGEKVSSRPMKRIKYEDGRLREFPANEVIRRKKCNEDSEEAEWLKWVHIANNWNHKPENAGKKPKTFDFCFAMFKKEKGHWPRPGMKHMPETDADKKRTPAAVFPWLAKKEKKQ